jgi:thymidylate synthase, flavin-dependent
MKVQLLTHTPNPEKIVAAAAKLCYSNAEIDTLMEGLTQEKAEEFVQMLATLGHESPTEHASFTFAIEGVSRSLLAQITRHRMATFSVQSQRYVQLDNFDYVLPPAIAEDEEATLLFEQTMQEEAKAYEKLTAILKEKHKTALMQEGKDEKQAERAAAKMAIEDARFVLPNACNTKMIVTMNTRSLQNFFHHRCCSRAQWEIRMLADEMLRLVSAVAPSLFVSSGPSCVAGPCPEGKMTCGKLQEMREKYKELKTQPNSEV